MKLFIFSILMIFSFKSFALSIGKEIEANVCKGNCKSEISATLTLDEGQENCKSEYVDGRSVSCCPKVPKNSEISDEKIRAYFDKNFSMGTCHWEYEKEAMQNGPAFCSYETCVDFNWPNQDNSASLIQAFRNANEKGHCEKTIYTNAIYLTKGESISVNAYKAYGNKKSLTAICE